MSSFSFHGALNNLSFGQLSVGILREIKNKNLNPDIFLIGKPEISSQKQDNEFNTWVNERINGTLKRHSRDTPIFKLWHLNGSLDSYGEKQNLLTFYELDSPTEEEVNIAKNQNKVFVTSNYTKAVFNDYGINNVEYLPLFFDSFNFSKINRQFFRDDRITFNLYGKFEKRKHHAKVIRAWAKKFGKNPKYYLQCAVYNPHRKKEDNTNDFNSVLNDSYFNIDFKPFYHTNEEFNIFMNSADITLAMSGGENWGLPEFHSVALGSHAVVLNVNGYKEWSNNQNAVRINPSGKIDAYDGIFFHQGRPYNQGRIFDFNEDDFISACEEAIKRVESQKINNFGLELQNQFTVSNTVDKIVSSF